MGIFEDKKKMVAAANYIFFNLTRRVNNYYARFCFSSVYLRDILIRVQLVKFVAES
jgi:hypothetical protein